MTVQATNTNGAATLQVGSLTNSGNLNVLNQASGATDATLNMTGGFNNTGTFYAGNANGDIMNISGALANNLTGVINIRETTILDRLGGAIANNGTVQLITGDLTVVNMPASPIKERSIFRRRGRSAAPARLTIPAY